TFQPVTLLPSSTISPANSWPGIIGDTCAPFLLMRGMSDPHTPTAITFSKTSSSFGTGISTSTTCNCLMPVICTAFMSFPLLFQKCDDFPGCILVGEQSIHITAP